MTHTLSAAEAAERLGVSRATLYAYVARGLIHSEPGGGDGRARRYSNSDVERLCERKSLRADSSRLPPSALHWGVPILESHISLIQDGALYYRGINACDLATRHIFEDVARFLWTGALTRQPQPQARRMRRATQRPPGRLMACMTAALLALPDAADPMAIVHALLGTVAPARHHASAAVLQHVYAPGLPDARRLFDALLILCADHELNVSSFTARCVASARTELSMAVLAGLCALTGELHGGHVDRVLSFLNSMRTPAQVSPVCKAAQRRDGRLPGFGHALYPDGDPRAATLLALMSQMLAHSRRYVLLRAVLDEAQALGSEPPTIDMALAGLAYVLEADHEAPLAWFAIGRSAGWIAHALEQIDTGLLIRPRARYIGVQPHARSS